MHSANIDRFNAVANVNRSSRRPYEALFSEHDCETAAVVSIGPREHVDVESVTSRCPFDPADVAKSHAGGGCWFITFDNVRNAPATKHRAPNRASNTVEYCRHPFARKFVRIGRVVRRLEGIIRTRAERIVISHRSPVQWSQKFSGVDALVVVCAPKQVRNDLATPVGPRH